MKAHKTKNNATKVKQQMVFGEETSKADKSGKGNLKGWRLIRELQRNLIQNNKIL